MADQPTEDDRDDDAQDRNPEPGSNPLPPKRITNREKPWTRPIGHSGHIDKVLLQLYRDRGRGQ